jgi:hypothetical protein
MDFEAFWIPGLNTEMDPDEALAIGYKWLDETDFAGKKTIRPECCQHAWESANACPSGGAVSDRLATDQESTLRFGNAILAVWPTFDTLHSLKGWRIAVDCA